jgi:DNA-binding phage protein
MTMKVSETLRTAVKAAIAQGKTRYVISRDSGVDHTALGRFLTERRDVRLSTVDRLAESLGLELTAKRAQTRPE